MTTRIAEMASEIHCEEVAVCILTSCPEYFVADAMSVRRTHCQANIDMLRDSLRS